MKTHYSVFQSNPDAAGGGASPSPAGPSTEQTQPLDTGVSPNEADAGTPPAKPGGGQGVASELTPELKARIDFEKRTAQLAYEKREANRRARDAEERAAQAEAARRDLESRIQGTPQKPTLDQFETMSDYIQAAARWEADQRIAETMRRMVPQQNAEHEQAQRMREAQAFQAQVEQVTQAVAKAAMDKYPDLKDLPPADLPNFWQRNPVAAQAILESETSADVLNYLVRNPDKAWRLAQGDPAATLREIGRIEALVATAMPKNSPGAPAPGERLRGGGSSVHKSLEDLPMDQFVRQREADIRKSRERK